MQIRVTLSPTGDAKIETISILEDLWHDYHFFQSRAIELDQPDSTANDRLIAKRYNRAALLLLFSYLEGVINHWLKPLVAELEWLKIERRPLQDKARLLLGTLSSGPRRKLEIGAAKRLRDGLVHLKPGSDLALYDEITGTLVHRTETRITSWLGEIESALGAFRHPNTQQESQGLRDALGTTIPDSEGYTGPGSPEV